MTEDDRLRPLNILIGDWDTTITMQYTDGSDGGTSKAIDRYRWTRNGMFVMHDVDADMGGERVLSLEVIALDPKGDGYTSRSFEPDGSFHDFNCRLAGPMWRIVGDGLRFSGKFSDDALQLSGKWEQQVGTGIWAPLMKVTLRKRSGAA